mgnify:CR=1 FL=1
MEKFKKCAALLRGDGEDLSVQSPLFEMNKLSVLVYKYTGIVKVSLERNITNQETLYAKLFFLISRLIINDCYGT